VWALELTNRDFEILEYLYHQGISTLDQLTTQFFTSPVSARVRIHQLKKHGYLVARPLTDLKSVSHAVYRNVTDLSMFGDRSNLHKYRVYTLGERLKAEYPRFDDLTHPVMWKHQIQLGRIRSFLEKEFQGCSFLSDPEVRLFWGQFKMGAEEVVPDLVMNYRTLKVAIELERNLKSEVSYYSRFVSYKNSDYTHVLYFCEKERIFRSISDQASSFFKIGVSLILLPQKVFQKSFGFQPIDQFLKS
jgi:hypothetical protein